MLTAIAFLVLCTGMLDTMVTAIAVLVLCTGRLDTMVTAIAFFVLCTGNTYVRYQGDFNSSPCTLYR